MRGAIGRGDVSVADTGAEQSPIRTLGILGAGRLGGVIAQLAASAGLRVLISASGDPRLIAGRAASLGAEPAPRESVIAESDAVLLALPLAKFRMLLPESFRGKLVIDAMNYWWASDGIRDEFSDPRTSTSELVQQHFLGARVVKALSHMGYHDMADDARPAGAADRKAIALAGDEASDIALVSSLIDALGFDPVPAGPLAAGIAFEPGAEAFGADVDAEQLREMVDGFWDSQRGIIVARARAESAH